MKRPRIALTQANGSLEELPAMLESRGFEVVRAPLVETVPRIDEKTVELARDLLALPWVLLTSRSTVEALRAMRLPLDGPLLGAIGPATADAAIKAGGKVAAIGAPSDSEGLSKAFVAHQQARGPVGLPRGSKARDTLERLLGEAGFVTMPLVVYDTVGREWPGGHVDAVVIASPSALESLPPEVARDARLIAIGNTTAGAVRARGWSCMAAENPGAGETLAAVERAFA